MPTVGVYVFVYVNVLVCLCLCMWSYEYVRVCVCVCVYVSVYALTRVYSFVFTHVCMRMCVWMDVLISMYHLWCVFQAYFSDDALTLIRTLITGGSTPELEEIFSEGMGINVDSSPASCSVSRPSMKRSRIAQLSFKGSFAQFGVSQLTI